MVWTLGDFLGPQKVVPGKNGYHGLSFPSTWVTMQGGLISPALFQVVVDNFIQTWLAMTVENHRVAHDGMGDSVSSCLGVFYAGKSVVGP